MPKPFNRRAILEAAAGAAVESIAHYREMLRHELATPCEDPSFAKWLRERHAKQQLRWARAAALIARLSLTLAERRMG